MSVKWKLSRNLSNLKFKCIRNNEPIFMIILTLNNTEIKNGQIRVVIDCLIIT